MAGNGFKSWTGRSLPTGKAGSPMEGDGDFQVVQRERGIFLADDEGVTSIYCLFVGGCVVQAEQVYSAGAGNCRIGA